MHILENIKPYLVKLRNALDIELEATYLLAPIFISIGIVIFFMLPTDPSPFVCLILLVIALILVYISRKSHIAYRACLLILAVSMGFFACEVRVMGVKAPRINEQLEYVHITGTIVQIIDTASTRKFLLDNLEIEDLSTEQTPKFVRISLKSDISGFAIGDRIELSATLMPPPHPSAPGGFNFAEYTYFKQIGAIGFATSRPYLVYSDDLNTTTKYINAFRHKIGNRIESRMEPASASVALALLIGDTSKINITDLTMIRTSGIAHIIAISGLHVVIIVGLIFLSTRVLLARFPYLVNHYDLKKISAVLGILGSFIYLIIAGSPISAQRAFIMSTITLFAIIIDRTSNPMRSVATAGMIVLLLTPENLFTPSLQMSFAACISLIAGFAITTKFLKPETYKIGGKFGMYVLGIVISTLLAGTATTPFVIYHFNQFSTYSLITNLFAIPLTNFIIMPLGVASLLLMPIHLDWLTLPPMGWAINSMVWIAKQVSFLPEASIHIASYSAAGIGLIALGGAMLCMMTTNLRFLSIPIILVGMLTNSKTLRGPMPDLMLDSKGKLFALKLDDAHYFSSKMSARFVRKSWEQSMGIADSLTIRDLESCDGFFCKLTSNNQAVAILYNGKYAPSNCEFNLFINLTEIKTLCNTAIDRAFLREHGTTFIWLKEEGIKIQSVAGTLKRRVWNHFKF